MSVIQWGCRFCALMIAVFGASSFAQEYEGRPLEDENLPETREAPTEEKTDLNTIIEEGMKFLREQSAKDQQEVKRKQVDSYRQTLNDADFTNRVVLKALNKITTHVSSVSVTKDEAARFGTLELILHSCWRAPPEENPESKALLEIWERVPGEERKRVFMGWMFASSPALSGFDHAVYDLSVEECVANER